MKKPGFLLLVLFLAWNPLWAQGASRVAQEILQSTVRRQAKQAVVPPADVRRLARLQHLNKTRFNALNRMLEPYFPPSAGIARKRLAENEKLQQEMVRRWLEMDFYISQQGSAVLGQHVVSRAGQGQIDYFPLLPASGQLIILGEYHDTAWIIEEVENAVRQIQQAYSGRTVYYAAEFLYAPPQEEFRLLRAEDLPKNGAAAPAYQALAARLAKKGVRLVGLENPSVRAPKNTPQHVTDGPSLKQWLWNAVSPLGMQERNRYWAQRIRAIYRQDPSAVVVVHAGNAHACYNHFQSIPWLLKDLKPFVISFTSGVDGNPLLEEAVPFRPEDKRQTEALWRKNPHQAVWFIRHFRGKRTALVAGSDVHISLYKKRMAPLPDWHRWEKGGVPHGKD